MRSRLKLLISGLALLNVYEWLDVVFCLDHYHAAILRFVSTALNRLIRRSLSSLPLRVIAALIVAYAEAEQRCWAYACRPDLLHAWSDLIFE